jgi:hypothetical protein
MYIANRAFVINRKFVTFNKHRQFFNYAFKVKKLKYKKLAQSKSESSLLSSALLAIY